jgi:hypothetical protein
MISGAVRPPRRASPVWRLSDLACYGKSIANDTRCFCRPRDILEPGGINGGGACSSVSQTHGLNPLGWRRAARRWMSASGRAARTFSLGAPGGRLRAPARERKRRNVRIIASTAIQIVCAEDDVWPTRPRFTKR